MSYFVRPRPNSLSRRLAAVLLPAAAVLTITVLGGCGTQVSFTMVDLAPPPMSYAMNARTARLDLTPSSAPAASAPSIFDHTEAN